MTSWEKLRDVAAAGFSTLKSRTLCYLLADCFNRMSLSFSNWRISVRFKKETFSKYLKNIQQIIYPMRYCTFNCTVYINEYLALHLWKVHIDGFLALTHFARFGCTATDRVMVPALLAASKRTWTMMFFSIQDKKFFRDYRITIIVKEHSILWEP